MPLIYAIFSEIQSLVACVEAQKHSWKFGRSHPVRFRIKLCSVLHILANIMSSNCSLHTEFTYCSQYTSYTKTIIRFRTLPFFPDARCPSLFTFSLLISLSLFFSSSFPHKWSTTFPTEVLVRQDEGRQTLPTQILKSFPCFCDRFKPLTAQTAIFHC